MASIKNKANIKNKAHIKVEKSPVVYINRRMPGVAHRANDFFDVDKYENYGDVELAKPKPEHFKLEDVVAPFLAEDETADEFISEMRALIRSCTSQGEDVTPVLHDPAAVIESPVQLVPYKVIKAEEHINVTERFEAPEEAISSLAESTAISLPQKDVNVTTLSPE